MNTATKVIVTIGSIAVIATAGVGGYMLATSNDSTASTPSTSSVASTSKGSASVDTPSASNNSATTGAVSTYRDGTYTALASYYVPDGTNNISTTVTVSSGNIASVTTDNKYSDRESRSYIDSFKGSLPGTVVGTSLADASFSRIGGASLTTDGFNSTLDTIRTQAAA